MSTTEDYMEYVCEQIKNTGNVRYRKMFGEYMVYVNNKPILLVCDNTPYIKMNKAIEAYMKGSVIGCPYDGAKEHYVLDIDNKEYSERVVRIMEEITQVPKPKKKRQK